MRPLTSRHWYHLIPPKRGSRGRGFEDIDPQIRRQIIARCRSRRTRGSSFTPDAPTRWQPRALRDPRSPEAYFTDDSAWEYIAQCLEKGCRVETIMLDHPPGKKGFVFKVPGYGPVQAIYVKLKLGSDKILGRSFHEDQPPTIAIVESSFVLLERRKGC